jgi:EAL domain-containing protein (putative c-di-GMP-specific phosphodiesterase class I)
MDDFGTGYSSLMSLRTYPFNKIKIDRTFVQDLASNPDAELVIKAVIVLGGGLGMRITAEGVETTEQLARLRAEGCDEVQGYLISAPVPPLRIPAMLDRWNSGARRGLISAVA